MHSVAARQQASHNAGANVTGSACTYRHGWRARQVITEFGFEAAGSSLAAAGVLSAAAGAAVVCDLAAAIFSPVTQTFTGFARRSTSCSGLRASMRSMLTCPC
jgi:hypothetical protein